MTDNQISEIFPHGRPHPPTERSQRRTRKEMIKRYMTAYNMAIARKHWELACTYQKAYISTANLVKNTKLSGAQKDARMLKINNLVENAELFYSPDAEAHIAANAALLGEPLAEIDHAKG